MSIVPFTESNIKLSFKPNLFFNDLEKLDFIKAKRKTIEAQYYRAIKRGLIEFDAQKIPRLTEKGSNKVELFTAKRLKNAKLLVVFDIPEIERSKRNHLRALLRELSFKQVQKSVWITDYDHRKYLRSEIKQHNLEKYVQIYEALKIN